MAKMRLFPLLKGGFQRKTGSTAGFFPSEEEALAGKNGRERALVALKLPHFAGKKCPSPTKKVLESWMVERLTFT